MTAVAGRAGVDLSVVVPMFNEAENLRRLFDRLVPVLRQLPESWEIVVVDDGSTDETAARLAEERDVTPELHCVILARNAGQHAAVVAGLEASSGRHVITLDADLQNPPEEIPKVLAAMRDGHDVVNTVRHDRRDGRFRRLASRANGWLVRRLSGVHLADFGCMLRGYDRRVADAMSRRHEYGVFLPALAMLYARRPIEIPVAHAPRAAGRSNYSIARLLRLQLDLVTTFSLAPLRALFTIGTVVAIASLLAGMTLLLLRVAYGSTWAVDGTFTLFAVLFLFVGLQFIAFGLLGEYVGRVYQEVRHRPGYVVREAWPSRPHNAHRDASPAFDTALARGGRG